MRLLALCLLVLSGCQMAPQPQAYYSPPAQAPAQAFEAPLRKLEQENQHLRTQVEKSQSFMTQMYKEQHYTGIRMLTHKNCGPCRRFLDLFDHYCVPRNFSRGDGPEYSVWTIESDGPVPIFEVVRDGVVTETVRGFPGDNPWTIMKKNPRYIPDEPRSSIPVRDRPSYVYGESSYTEPPTVWETYRAYPVNNYSTYSYPSYSYPSYSYPSSSRCANGMCW